MTSIIIRIGTLRRMHTKNIFKHRDMKVPVQKGGIGKQPYNPVNDLYLHLYRNYSLPPPLVELSKRTPRGQFELASTYDRDIIYIPA